MPLEQDTKPIVAANTRRHCGLEYRGAARGRIEPHRRMRVWPAMLMRHTRPDYACVAAFLCSHPLPFSLTESTL